jgi:hypothetical protein
MRSVAPGSGSEAAGSGVARISIKALRTTPLLNELLRFLREAVNYSKRSAVSKV